MWTVVDFPAPLGPRNPKISPGATASSMPSTARMPPLNSRARPVAWMPCASRMGARLARKLILSSIYVVKYHLRHDDRGEPLHRHGP
jgi:hypothetical protein